MSRLGGVAAIALAATYVAITGLYVVAGAVPDGGGRAWLEYLDGRQAAWWSITGLSVLTDVLFLAVAAALFAAVRRVDERAALAGAGLLALFAILDLAITWPSYAGLIGLATQYGATPDEARRASLAVAAETPAAVLGSGLFKAYAILVPALGILVLGWAMRRSAFGRGTAYLGVFTGAFGAAAVAGSLVVPALGSAVILTSVLTTLWVLLVGVRLLGPGGAASPAAAAGVVEAAPGRA
jgi:hypothetical protein